MNDSVIRIETSHHALPFNNDEGNFDTVITGVPRGWYVGDTMLVQVVGVELRKIGAAAALACGRHLHHAEFIITDDPEVVKERGQIHDCATCRAGVDQSLAVMRDSPGIRLCVGSLWYVPRAVRV